MPMWRRRMMASWFSSMPTIDVAGDGDVALVGHVEAGDQVEQGRLAAARRAHHGDELAAGQGRGRRPAAPAPAQCPARRSGRRRGPPRPGRLGRLAGSGRRRAGRPPAAGAIACSSPVVGAGVGRTSSALLLRGQDRGDTSWTGASRPFTVWGAELLGPGGPVRRARPTSPRSSTVWPGSANCCRRWPRFTASPTTVYSMRSSEPSRAAATSPVDRPMPSPNGGQALRRPRARSPPPARRAWPAPAASARSAWSADGTGRAEHGHDRVADVLHDGAALAEDGPVHLGPVGVELGGQRGRVGVLGDRRVAADVATSAR